MKPKVGDCITDCDPKSYLYGEKLIVNAKDSVGVYVDFDGRQWLIGDFENIFIHPKCPRCDGIGLICMAPDKPTTTWDDWKSCPDCNGTGYVDGEEVSDETTSK